MSERNQGMSRRSLLKGVAASGVVVAVGGLVPESYGGDMTHGSAEVPQSNSDWFSQRLWSLSGNKVPMKGGGAIPVKSLAPRVFLPRSAQEIADLVKSLPATTPIACVGGAQSTGPWVSFKSRRQASL